MEINEYELGEISIVKNGTKNKEDQVINGKYNFYTRSKQILKSDDYNIDGKYTIIPGEGIFYPLWNDGKAAIHQRVYYIKANNDFILDKYLYYWWIKNSWILDKNAVGTTVKSLRLNNFLQPKILLPNLEAQQEIINIIEPFEKILEKNNEKVSKINLKCLLIINEVKRVNVGKIIDNNIIFEKGINFKKDMISINEKEIPFINISAMNGKTNTFIKKEYKNLVNVKFGDVLLSLDGTPGIVNNFLDGINGYAYKLISKHESNNYKIYFSLLTNINQKMIKKYSVGTTILHAGKSIKELFLFDFGKYNKFLKSLYSYEINLKKQNKILKKIMSALIDLSII